MSGRKQSRPVHSSTRYPEYGTRTPCGVERGRVDTADALHHVTCIRCKQVVLRRGQPAQPIARASGEEPTR